MMVAALDATAMIRIFRSVLCGLRGRASLDPSPNVPTKDSSAFDSNWLHTVRSCAGGGNRVLGWFVTMAARICGPCASSVGDSA